MKIPQLFLPEEAAGQKKIDTFINEVPKVYKIDADKKISKLELKLVKDNREVFISYFPYITYIRSEYHHPYYYDNQYLEALRKKYIKIKSRFNHDQEIKGLMGLANDIGFYHKGFQSIIISYCNKGKSKEFTCDLVLKRNPDSESVLKAVNHFYPSLFDKITVQKVTYKR
ncbi:MAG: hypothetical protein Q8N77_03935 [Nanoarchaeota archaeon]|nr:hypothetical protein [Nanoarchaeota archaeon]